MQMFSGSRKVEPVTPMAPTPPPAPVRPEPTPNGAADLPRAGGILSSGVSIKGSVKFQKELHIDGEVEGKIDSNGRLTIGEHAKIKGEIRTKSVVVDGTVEGNITAGERCELRAGCTVHGDIESPRLVVDEAATFIGSAKIATQSHSGLTSPGEKYLSPVGSASPLGVRRSSFAFATARQVDACHAEAFGVGGLNSLPAVASRRRVRGRNRALFPWSFSSTTTAARSAPTPNPKCAAASSPARSTPPIWPGTKAPPIGRRSPPSPNSPPAPGKRLHLFLLPVGRDR